MQFGFNVSRKLSVSLVRTKFSQRRRRQRTTLQNNREGTGIPQYISQTQVALVWQGQRFPADAASGPDEKEEQLSLLRELKPNHILFFQRTTQFAVQTQISRILLSILTYYWI